MASLMRARSGTFRGLFILSCSAISIEVNPKGIPIDVKRRSGNGSIIVNSGIRFMSPLIFDMGLSKSINLSLDSNTDSSI